MLVDGNTPSDNDINQVINRLFKDEKKEVHEEVNTDKFKNKDLNKGTLFTYIYRILNLNKVIYFLVLLLLILFVFLIGFFNSNSTVCSTPITNTGGTGQFSKNRFQQYLPVSIRPESSIIDTNIRSIAINEIGLWIGYGANSVNAISYYDGLSWLHCRGLLLKGNGPINGFAFRNGSIFVATDNDGVIELNNNEWSRYDEGKGLYNTDIYNFYTDIESNLYALSYEGVYKFDGNYWNIEYQESPNGLRSNQIHAFTEDLDGNRWFGFISDGIDLLTPTDTWIHFQSDNPGTQNVRNVIVDNDGAVWFATDGGGILRYYENNWENFTLASSDLPTDHVHDIEQDSLGRIWAATDNGIIYTSNSGQSWDLFISVPTLDVEFGCNQCVFDQRHMWFVIKDQGLGHVELPNS